MAMAYTAGHNMVGYLPEVDPEEFDTEAEARDYLASELERWADQEYMVGEPELDEVGERFEDAARELRRGSTQVFVEGDSATFNFWVTEHGGE